MTSFKVIQNWQRAMWSPISPVDHIARSLWAYLASRYHYKSGQLFLALATIMADTGLSETTVRDRLRVLEENKCIRRSQKTKRSVYDFELLEPPWLEAAQAARDARRAVFQSSPGAENAALESSPDEPKQRQENHLTEQNRARRGFASRRRFDSLPLPVQAVTRGLQQLTQWPYCASYDRLIPTVLGAVERCGLPAVEQLYTMLTNHSDTLPACKLYQVLNALRGESDVSEPPKAEDSGPLPPRSLIEEAKREVEDAHITKPLEMAAILRRIKEAGFEAQFGWWQDRRHMIAQALARTIAVERGIAP